MCVCPMHSNCGYYRTKTIAYSESAWPGGAALATNLATSWSQEWMSHGNVWVTGMYESRECMSHGNVWVTGMYESREWMSHGNVGVTGMNGFLIYSESKPDLTKPK